MTATVPVPIEFQLPEGWAPAVPTQIEASGVAYAALRKNFPGPFAPNITVTAQSREDEQSLAAIADEVVDRLRRTADEVELTERRVVGTDDVPGITQSVRLAVPVDDKTLHLVQVQAVLVLKDKVDPRRRAVYLFALTAAREHVEALVPEFREFVATVRVVGQE